MSRIVIIGAGMGGLAAAIALASAGADVTVLERAAAPGGKMRVTPSAIGPVDAGPTVFTMRFVFDELFEGARLSMDDFVRIEPLTILARHAWSHGPTFDLPADPRHAADAVGAFAGPKDAEGFRRFLADSARIYNVLLAPFMTAQKPSPFSLLGSMGLGGALSLMATRPFESLWSALGDYFKDPRLRQLFARYATYTGASPYMAPATLMLIAHAEQRGVWSVTGGMHALARGMADAAAACGAQFRYHSQVRDIEVAHGRVCGVTTRDGERFPADAVIANADLAALAAGAFGASVAGAVPRPPKLGRSLSALTWTGAAETSGFDLQRHTVFFGDAYRSEFDDIFSRGALPHDPTLYICAQDRLAPDDAPSADRLLILANAPATADTAPLSQEDLQRCRTAAFTRLARAGLKIKPLDPLTETTPQDFQRMFPHTGGAIYGTANHGPFAAFQRAGARTKLPGLYLAGGSVHPSAGVPMATLSGRLAAAALLADQPSIRPFRPVDISGGISTRSAKTAASD